MEKNIPSIKKSETPYGELQQFVLEKISEFTCLRCKKNKVSNHDASVKVGQKLVDTFIKPNMDKDKKK